jgi:hypothetical protein
MIPLMPSPRPVTSSAMLANPAYLGLQVASRSGSIHHPEQESQSVGEPPHCHCYDESPEGNERAGS